MCMCVIYPFYNIILCIFFLHKCPCVCVLSVYVDFTLLFYVILSKCPCLCMFSEEREGSE